MARCLVAVLTFGAVAALAAPLPISGQSQPVFRSNVRTVAVYATVRQDGRLVPDLQKDAFEIRDNGKPSPITVFSNDPQPITVVLLVDMSGSMTSGFLRVREGTLKFISALAPVDRLRIGTFGAEISLSPLLTGDKNVLDRIALEELWPGGGTPLWNAMYAGMQSLKDEQGRRVILVLTDGADTGSLRGWTGSAQDVDRMATQDGFTLYAIGVESDVPLQGELVAMTEETGGGHFIAADKDDLGAVFERVAEELRHQYLLGFVPAVVDGKEHKLEVRARRGMTVTARRSFVAQK